MGKPTGFMEIKRQTSMELPPDACYEPDPQVSYEAKQDKVCIDNPESDLPEPAPLDPTRQER